MTDNDSSDVEIVYDGTQQHCDQDPFEFTQASPMSLASLPRRSRALPQQDSSSDSEASANGDGGENLFQVLQQQLMKQEMENVGLKDSHNDSRDEPVAQSGRPSENAQPHFPTASPDDWPDCDDACKHALIELERSRKRLRKSLDFPKEISHARVVTPWTESTSALTSIVGTRPQHWIAGRMKKLERIGIRELDAFRTPSSKRPMQLGKATRPPFSLENASRMTVRQSTKSFAPALLGKQLTSNIDYELNENAEPWYQRTKTNQPGKRSIKAASKKKIQGPLMQKYTELRAAMNADIVRLQSRMSMHDPRKGKPYLDVQLMGTSTPLLDRHVVVMGKIDETFAWIVLEKPIPGPCVLRVYNPIRLRLEPVRCNGIGTVVICTRFHEVF
ncbi:hypothetical protein MHU86_4445 [Fragilaria crotonensis]|nr:hypothetical protein MHU86_4445 [Fragilaria crotonensis]